MEEEIEFYLDDARESMKKALVFVNNELTKVRAGKASPDMLSGVIVDYYGASTPLSQVANVNVGDARTLLIRPWEKNMLSAIERAIINGDTGFNPQNDGEQIRINVPALTEERRRDLVKKAKAECENGKVRLRTIRKETNDELKKLLKDGASEDAVKQAEERVQGMIDKFTKEIEELLEKKEVDIMKV
jgi:ribosome recycling factor